MLFAGGRPVARAAGAMDTRAIESATLRNSGEALATSPARSEERGMIDRDCRKADVDRVEQASLDSFPASDPPGWIAMCPGLPARGAEAPRPEPARRETRRTEID